MSESSIKEIFEDTAKLIDMLNILISKIDGYNSKLPIILMDEVSDLCFALGSNLCVAQKELGSKEEDDNKEDNLYNIEML